MLVGIMADSHDNVPAIDKAVQVFNDAGVGLVIHAGDFVAPFSLLPLANLACPWIGVFGNNDGERKGLTHASKGRIQPDPYSLNVDGKKTLVVHDLDTVSEEEWVKNGTQILIYAHSHLAQIDQKESLLRVNPGELGGWLNQRKTVAILDTQNLVARVVDIE